MDDKAIAILQNGIAKRDKNVLPFTGDISPVTKLVMTRKIIKIIFFVFILPLVLTSSHRLIYYYFLGNTF
ncbi:MAG: hypothetical protein ABS949_17745 [Solibacillus sp.]